MQYRQRRHSQNSFEEFEAASLFCPKCREAVPVRKRLLLTLPNGDKYDYYCAVCGTVVGGKMDAHTQPIMIPKGLSQ
ncbi:MAG: hypothetical protein N3B18_06035 [Desulfobacterota bacterium]|nr:hypothetical protein [Thermodesulfobacteriota bacterium]